MSRLNVKTCLPGLGCVMLIVALQSACCGQSVDEWAHEKRRDDFASLTDKRFRKEIAMFSIVPSFEKEFEKAPKLELEEIPLKNCSDNSVEFLGGGIHVVIEKMKFDTIGHQLGYTDHYLNLIDGKPFWGTDGEVPRARIRSIAVRLGKHEIALPKTSIEGLYEPNICKKDHFTGKFMGSHAKVFRSLDKQRVYIFMLNSDGAGGYEVTWIFQNGKYVRRVVDYGF